MSRFEKLLRKDRGRTEKGKKNSDIYEPIDGWETVIELVNQQLPHRISSLFYPSESSNSLQKYVPKVGLNSREAGPIQIEDQVAFSLSCDPEKAVQEVAGWVHDTVGDPSQRPPGFLVISREQSTINPQKTYYTVYITPTWAMKFSLDRQNNFYFSHLKLVPRVVQADIDEMQRLVVSEFVPRLRQELIKSLEIPNNKGRMPQRFSLATYFKARPDFLTNYNPLELAGLEPVSDNVLIKQYRRKQFKKQNKVKFYRLTEDVSDTLFAVQYNDKQNNNIESGEVEIYRILSADNYRELYRQHTDRLLKKVIEERLDKDSQQVELDPLELSWYIFQDEHDRSNPEQHSPFETDMEFFLHLYQQVIVEYIPPEIAAKLTDSLFDDYRTPDTVSWYPIYVFEEPDSLERWTIGLDADKWKGKRFRLERRRFLR